MDQCLANLSDEGVIAELPGMHDPTMSLFLKPKDENTARVICDLRPLNAAYDQKPPRFHLPSVSLLLQSTRWWSRTFFTKLDVTAYFHSLFFMPVLVLLLPGWEKDRKGEKGERDKGMER